MSPIVLQDKLRGELGYKNIIITDGMEMGAITQHYTSGEAAVGSIKAGVDIVLGPRDFTEAFDAVMNAVKNGSISEERINQSVRRILTLRLAMNR
jgi:beta-N-acetylhexosaminidase